MPLDFAFSTDALLGSRHVSMPRALPSAIGRPCTVASQTNASAARAMLSLALTAHGSEGLA